MPLISCSSACRAPVGQPPGSVPPSVHRLRLNNQTTTDCFEHDHDVKPRAAHTAVRLFEQHCEHAELGKPLPHIAAAARGRVRDALPRIEAVFFPNKSLERVRQHAAVFAVLKSIAVPISETEDHLGDDVPLDFVEPPNIDSLR